MPIISAITAALSLAQTIGGLVGKAKPDEALQEYYDMLKEQGEEGLPASVESALYSRGAGRIARQATGMQARGSAALASRGMGRSSVADTMIGDVSRIQAESLGDLESRIMQADVATKQQAMGAMGGAAAGMAASRASEEQNLQSMIMGGLSGLVNRDVLAGLGLGKSTSELRMEEFKSMWDLLFPEGSELIPQIPIRQDVLGNFLSGLPFMQEQAPMW